MPSMKRLLLACLMTATGLTGWNRSANAQMLQTLIASPGHRNELVTCVKALPDGSAILGGYIYDIVSNTPVNLDMLLLRVRQNGSIVWQKQMGSSGDDILNSLIITQNTDVVVVGTVGRSSTYQDNTAAIYRFDTAGTLLWQKYIRVTPGASSPGDKFADVAELSNGNLIAVGTHDFTPGICSSLICSFQANGSLNYMETHDHTGSDDFWSVCSVGNDVIIGGGFDGANYRDCRIMRYRPGTTNGTIIWDKAYDISNSKSPSGTTMTCDLLTSVYVRGGKVMASGAQLRDWYSKPPNIPIVFQCDLATGGNAQVHGLLSRNLDYGNNSAFYPVDSVLCYTAQNPDSMYEDAVIWTAPSFTNALISKVQPFGTTPQVLTSREFNLPGEQSIFSMDMLPNVLFMAGCSNAGGTTVNNDIYYVVSMSSLTNPNASCDLIDDSMRITTPTLVPEAILESIAYPASTGTFTMSFTNPNLVSSKACGEVWEFVKSKPTAVLEPTGNDFKVYPNPTNSNLILSVPRQIANGSVDITVMNATGQKVLSTTTSIDAGGKASINVSSLPAGSFFLCLRTAGETVGIRPFTIVR